MFSYSIFRKKFNIKNQLFLNNLLYNTQQCVKIKPEIFLSLQVQFNHVQFVRSNIDNDRFYSQFVNDKEKENNFFLFILTPFF